MSNANRRITIATIILSLGFAATGAAHARALNHHQHQPGYDGPVYSSTPSVGSWEFVPGRGIVGESCDLPTSACSNDERTSN